MSLTKVTYSMIENTPANIKDFGAVGDGVTNDSAAFTAAFAASQNVYVPIGTYIATFVIPSNATLVGESRQLSIIKAPPSTDATVISGTNAYSLFGSSEFSQSAGSNNVTIRNLTIDGNRTNVTNSGDGIAIWGWGTVIESVTVQNVRTFGIHTEWTDGNISMEGTFNDILIKNVGEHGWNFCGPHDSYFSNVIIIDASQNADNTFYGMYIGSNGASPSSANGRFYNLHVWHTSGTTNRCAYAVYSNQGANQFFGCHFEGCRKQLRLNNSEIISGCYIYAQFGANGSSMTTISGNDNIISSTLFVCNETAGINPNGSTSQNADVFAIELGATSAGNLVDACKFVGYKLRSPFNFLSGSDLNVISNSYGFCSTGGATSFAGTVSTNTAVEYMQDGTIINYRKPRFYTYASDDTAAAAAGTPIGGFYVKTSTYALTARTV